MDIFFADDARQDKPSRPGMGPLIATGGVYVPGNSVRDLEKDLDRLCVDYSFPQKEPFKWSPGRELWMHSNLIDDRRRDFYIRSIQLAQNKGVRAIVIVEGTNYLKANERADSYEIDATLLLFERIHRLFDRTRSHGIIIADRPSGGRKDEERFLVSCSESIHSGTEYVKPYNIALNVVSSPSKLIRLLQLADLITSCTLAMIGGERSHAPEVFNEIKVIMDRDMDRIGGVGLKLHPDFRFVNLYHWILDDEYYFRMNMGHPLPLKHRPYSRGPFTL